MDESKNVANTLNSINDSPRSLPTAIGTATILV